MNTPLVEDLNFLAHYGKKGMKWGVRNDPQVSGGERKAARKDIRDVAKAARSVKKAAGKATTTAEKKAVIDRYQKEVMAKIKDPAFKKTWDAANTISKGETAVQYLAFGPLGKLTVNSIKSQYAIKREIGLDAEIGAGQAILRELRAS